MFVQTVIEVQYACWAGEPRDRPTESALSSQEPVSVEAWHVELRVLMVEEEAIASEGSEDLEIRGGRGEWFHVGMAVCTRTAGGW